MKPTTLQIDELRLRVNGYSREQARRLGEMVANRLAEPQQPIGISGTLPSLTISVPANHPTSLERMADLIAAKVIRSLK
jgi:hypothetical protein